MTMSTFKSGVQEPIITLFLSSMNNTHAGCKYKHDDYLGIPSARPDPNNTS